jgi:tetratricopeptide (TPR) repeat protein
LPEQQPTLCADSISAQRTTEPSHIPKMGFRMKPLPAALSILSVILTAPEFAQPTSLAATDQLNPSDQTTVPESTPAQQRIAAAKQQIEADPKKIQAYNELTLAFIRRARETADLKYLNDADAALTQGLKLDASDFQLQKTQVALLSSRHQFIEARDQATNLHLRMPDDVMTYGYLAEADIALGKYADAETNAQWMMNMRPNNTPALLVGAQLRLLYGDARGAIEFLNQAYSQTSPAEVEELAWIANQIASIQIDSGQKDDAAQTLEQVEQIFPDYPCTIENLARVRMGQSRAKEAIQLWTKATSVDSDPHLLYELARAQEAAGQSEEARVTYARFEKLANAPDTATEDSKLDLILLYAETPATASNALQLAEHEVIARQDVSTLDAYAWALYVNGKYQEADETIQKVLAVGIQSARMFDHAGHIAQKLNNLADATKYFQRSAQVDPSSEYADDARASLGLPMGANGFEKKSAKIDSAIETSSALSDATASRQSSAPEDRRDRTEMPAGIGMTAASLVFVPVPRDLMTPQPTGTNHLIHTAQVTVTRNPKDATGYAGLGAAYFQRARETGDVSDYQLAEESLTKSLDLNSADFSADTALETMAEICMGEHRFADALGFAQKALSLGTGDLSPFALVGDAYADMGEYDKAGVAYSKLTPRDRPLSPRAAYARDSRLSYLKFIGGDTGAAIRLMKAAVTEGIEAQLQNENLAWLYYELGEFYTQAGDANSADTSYLAALNAHPGDYRALAALARLRANNGRYAEAIVLYQKAIAVVPMPIFIAELGDLYARAGNQAEAQKQYALVEYIGLLGHINQVLHNRDLALFYADHDMKLSEALNLAQKELEVRRDIYTWDALAWVLYKNGKLEEAAKASQRAMQFGTRDALLLFHAGMIAEGLGHREEARSALEEALQINPHFHLIYTSMAQQRLVALEALAESKGASNDDAR